MSIQGEINEFVNLLFGELNERRFAQVIKVGLTGLRFAQLHFFF